MRYSVDESREGLHLKTGSHDDEEVALCEIFLEKLFESLGQLLSEEDNARLHDVPADRALGDSIRQDGFLHLCVCVCACTVIIVTLL